MLSLTLAITAAFAIEKPSIIKSQIYSIISEFNLGDRPMGWSLLDLYSFRENISLIAFIISPNRKDDSHKIEI